MATTARGAGSRSTDGAGRTARAAGEARAVRRYLELLDRSSGRVPVDEAVAALRDEARRVRGVERLELVQRRLELEGRDPQVRAAAEAGFVAHAAAYGQRASISWAAWREAGVSAAVLRRAGITPGRSSQGRS